MVRIVVTVSALFHLAGVVCSYAGVDNHGEGEFCQANIGNVVYELLYELIALSLFCRFRRGELAQNTRGYNG